MIPEAAVEAALNSIIGGNEVTGPDIALDLLTREQVRAILEAAAPHMLADEGSPCAERKMTPAEIEEWRRTCPYPDALGQ